LLGGILSVYKFTSFYLKDSTKISANLRTIGSKEEVQINCLQQQVRILCRIDKTTHF